MVQTISSSRTARAFNLVCTRHKLITILLAGVSVLSLLHLSSRLLRVYYFLDAGLAAKEAEARYAISPFRSPVDRLVPALKPSTKRGKGPPGEPDLGSCGVLKANERRYAEAVRVRREKVLAADSTFSWGLFDATAWKVQARAVHRRSTCTCGHPCWFKNKGCPKLTPARCSATVPRHATIRSRRARQMGLRIHRRGGPAVHCAQFRVLRVKPVRGVDCQAAQRLRHPYVRPDYGQA